jgi:hypothetical protein
MAGFSPLNTSLSLNTQTQREKYVMYKQRFTRRVVIIAIISVILIVSGISVALIFLLPRNTSVVTESQGKNSDSELVPPMNITNSPTNSPSTLSPTFTAQPTVSPTTASPTFSPSQVTDIKNSIRAKIVNSNVTDFQNFGKLFSRNFYDYAPSFMEDRDGKWRLWWCGGVAGDHILYSQSNGSLSDWSSPISVFQNNRSSSFDGTHTCDPSVIEVNGVYFLYYGGFTDILVHPEVAANHTTQIGVASSVDGITWKRGNEGQPIITYQVLKGGIDYGAGQPSAISLDGWIYIIHTDTSGKASLSNGAGQYVLRCQDPFFRSGIQALTRSGFVPYNENSKTNFSILEAFSVDWCFSDLLDGFIIAEHSAADCTRLHLFSRDLSHEIKEWRVPGAWAEGPGILKKYNGHCPISRKSITTSLPVKIVYTTPLPIEEVNNWDLAFKSAEIDLGFNIQESSFENRFGRAMSGYLILLSGLPWTFITNQGKRLQIESDKVAYLLTRNTILSPSIDSAAFHVIPYGAALVKGAKVIGSTGMPAGFILDDNLIWPVANIELISENNSTISMVPLAEYQQYPFSGDVLIAHRQSS